MRAAPIAALALVLTGCAMTTARLGSNAAVATAPEAQAMAADSLAELVKLYPPAISRLAIDASASDDVFGHALTDGLRKRGYAVVEGSRKAKADPSAVPLRYVVDQPMTGYYRVMLRVGEQSLTRGYTTEGGVAPSAGWALNLSGASEQLVERATRPDLPGDAEQVQAEVAAVNAGLVGPAVVAVVDTPEPVYQPSAPASRVTIVVPPAKLGRPAASPAGWRVQFAAFRTDRTARSYWRSLVQKKPALAALKPRFPRSSRGVVFVQAGPYRTVAFAKRVCGGLNANACIVVKA
ncbi:SPOR domain-containing protein (plasmid) [Sphingobium limneticum]|jgi:hypothetical protein|uniref:SPOR domain-containing protein n=1 Tax=Sphingobium TaxID=165695 RepID=UPI002397767E|nr:SPOR domain-containing protein [Sphingomonas bacterium]|tara:strand:+ start:6836 stop:7714 length:879 start_codon:yes stop_codon:yes gene_type:complete